MDRETAETNYVLAQPEGERLSALLQAAGWRASKLADMLLDEEVRAFRNLERRRMIEVKNRLADELAGVPVTSDRLVLCARYLEFIMGRFLAQGEANLSRLRSEVPESDDDGRRVVRELDDMLSGARRVTDDLAAAAAEGADNARLADVSGRFVDYYNTRMAMRKTDAQEIIAKYIPADEYWSATADVTSETIALEKRLYESLPLSAAT